MMNKKILVVVTNVEQYPNIDRATGLWLGEVVHFVKKLIAAGYIVDYLSPKGGNAPIDPHSLERAEPIEKEWYQDQNFRKRLENTLKPSEVNPDEYAAIYYAGGHGTLWDFPDDKALQSISESIYGQGGYITSVCHGAVGLLNIKLEDGQLVASFFNQLKMSSSPGIAGFSTKADKWVIV